MWCKQIGYIIIYNNEEFQRLWRGIFRCRRRYAEPFYEVNNFANFFFIFFHNVFFFVCNFTFVLTCVWRSLIPFIGKLSISYLLRCYLIAVEINNFYVRTNNDVWVLNNIVNLWSYKFFFFYLLCSLRVMYTLNLSMK